MENLVYISLFAPLVGAILASIFAWSDKKIFIGITTSALLATSMVSSIMLLIYVSGNDAISLKMFDWIVIGDLSIPFGFVVDSVSAIMMSVVTIVSTIVLIYSIGYMEHDKGFNRFFSYLSAFVFSMMFLVMSDNFAGLFVGWEGVGLCSWLLIGFWYKKDTASWAANEAFIMNRIADLGMLIGIFLIYWNIGSLQYSDVFANISSVPSYTVMLIGIFLFIGAMGKSAQFPFHPWLADAMEGPTPVSALIHAATMVTAGVYLVIRSNEIFSLIPDVGYFIACLGAFVAMFAASMALVNRDLKRIIAYSTLSQLGYMFVAAGLGAYWIALFHLVTHAFFKALLFLGAGNVMHAMDNELDIKKMGGLFGAMKYTAILMIIASVALSGIYPFAGFFSKDKILEVAFSGQYYILWFVLFVTAGLTAFYSFRLIMHVFFGEEKYKAFGLHPHETYKFIIIAMSPLAILAMIAGLFEEQFIDIALLVLPSFESQVSHMNEIILIGVTSLIAISGILFAIIKYNNGGFSKNIQESRIYKLLYNQYYIPNIYDNYVTKPYYKIANFLWKEIDVKIIDSIVDLVAEIMLVFGKVSSYFFNSGNLSKMLRIMAGGIIFLAILAILFIIPKGL